eukprot:76366-Pyramimonas_sp.AAC.1
MGRSWRPWRRGTISRLVPRGPRNASKTPCALMPRGPNTSWRKGALGVLPNRWPGAALSFEPAAVARRLRSMGLVVHFRVSRTAATSSSAGWSAFPARNEFLCRPMRAQFDTGEREVAKGEEMTEARTNGHLRRS